LNEPFTDSLNVIACESLQIRVFNSKNPKKVSSLIQKLRSSRLKSIELIFPYNALSCDNDINTFITKSNRITQLLIYDSPLADNKILKGANVIFEPRNLSSELHCGRITENHFAPNLLTFTESIHHNSCLNRKISIDTEGNIKNCPSMSQSFGNIKDTTLQEALDHPDFKKYWNVTKDQISVCKDCEFRYICTDCRGYIENPEDMYSKPLKCGYNPYTCEWEEWSTNPLKQKAIDYYGMREVLPEFKMKPDYAPSINPDPA
jgi:SPASM domain peptide maturase of grasp-with-spasm system